MSKHIKVLYIGDKFGRGNATFHGVTKLYEWWFARFDYSRFDVKLIGLRPPDASTERLREHIPNLVSLSRGKFDFRTVTDIVRLIRAEQADIIHLHGYGAANFGRMAKYLTGVKTVVHEHMVFPPPIYQKAFDFALAYQTDVGMAVSNAVCTYMIKERFVPADRMHTIITGIPLGKFKIAPPDEIEAERRQWGLQPDETVIATVGRLDEFKGIDYLLEAAARLVQEGFRFKLLIIGDGPYRPNLEEKVSQLHLEDMVIFTGYHGNIPRILSLVDIQVFPSLFEGGPLTLFEAMAMDIAVVGTNTGFMGDVIQDEVNGRMIQMRDSEGLADVLADLLRNPDKAKRLAEQAKKDSVKYDIQVCVDKMQQVYEDLMR